MKADNALLPEVKNYVSQFITDKVPKEYAYHDLQHTVHVVDGVTAIGSGLNLSINEMEIVQLAAWFHDTGYDKGADGHEERSSQYARQYLSHKQYPTESVALIVGCILATKLPSPPGSLLENIVCDADFSHLGSEQYWDRCGKVRQELALTRNLLMSEQEWTEFELRFMTNHKYFTKVASDLYGTQKAKHIKQLKKRRKRLVSNNTLTKKKRSKKK